MATHVRLRRIGKRPAGKPHFRLSVFDGRRGRDSKVIEELGFYRPLTGESKINKERLNYWVKNGAVLSLTVKSLLKKANKEA